MRNKSVILAGSVLALGTLGASAVQYRLDSVSSWGTTISGTLYNTSMAPYETFNNATAASIYIHRVDGLSDVENGYPATLETFCTDLAGVLYIPSVVDFHAVTFASQAGEPPHWAPQGINNAAWLYKTYLPGATDIYQKAGLQLAIWKSLYDSTGYQDLLGDWASGTGWDSGRLRITSASDAAILTDAAGLKGLETSGSAFGLYTDYLLAPEGYENGNTRVAPSQGLLNPLHDPPLHVPDSSMTIVMMGFSFSVIALGRKHLAQG